MFKFSKRGVPLTRNNETMTEAQFWAWIKQALRRLTMQWKPGTAYLKDIRRPYVGPNKHQKYEYPCEHCNQWFSIKEVEKDHIIECGAFGSWEEVAIWGSRAFIEKHCGWACLCKPCHLKKSLENRK